MSKRTSCLQRRLLGRSRLAGVIGSPAWKVKKTWFIVSDRDRAISPDLQRLEANRMHAMTITLPTSHVSMLADPYNVATVILRAAAQSE